MPGRSALRHDARGRPQPCGRPDDAELPVWCRTGRRVMLLFVALAPVACAVGPDFHRPAPPPGGYMAGTPVRIDGAGSAGDSQTLSTERDVAGDWWTLFRSPALNALISLALRNNPTLAAAQATLLQARETVRADEGTLVPSISGASSVTHQKVSGAEFGNVSSGATTSTPATGSTGTGTTGTTTVATAVSVYDLYNASVNVSYGVDLWGGERRGLEQVRAQADFERFVLEATYLTLTANVVTAAVAEASLNAQIAATGQVVQAEQSGLRVVAAQLAAGAVTRAELLQQQAQLQATLATLPPLRLQLAEERNLLSTYLGVSPDRYDGPDFDLASLQLPVDLPVSLPSALLAQRPDIRQSEAQLHEATAAVGVATANLLPQINLTGNVGSDALRLGQLFAAGSGIYAIAAQLTQPLFQGGALVHRRRAAIAGMKVAMAMYQATVIDAFANVSDALLALRYDAMALQVARDAADSARGSLSLLQVQYGAGAVNELAVLNAEQTAQTALLSLARAQAARYADVVALFQALGGGWWNRSDIAPKVTQCCHLFQ